MLFSPGFIQNSEVGKLIEKYGRMINSSDQNIAVRQCLGAENTCGKCFELRNRMEGSIDREGDVFSRQRFFLMKFHTFAQLENKPSGTEVQLSARHGCTFPFIEI